MLDLMGMVPLLPVALPVWKPQWPFSQPADVCKIFPVPRAEGLALPWRENLLLEAEEGS